MPVFKLDGPDHEIPELAVVGTFADAPGDFIAHVALQRKTQKIRAGQETEVWQMGPPGVAGELTSREANQDKGRSRADAVGFAHLPRDAHKRMHTWLFETDSELSGIPPWQQYIVHPPVKREADPKTKRGFRRFSCGGFVAECYRAGLRAPLVSTDQDDLPPVSLDFLCKSYGEKLRQSPPLRKHLGLVEGTTWRILLAGYVLHALSRTIEQVFDAPFKPQDIGAAYFPNRQQGSASPP